MNDLTTTWRLPAFEDLPLTVSNGVVAIAIAVGTLYCFLGYRTLRLIIILTGFLLASAVAGALAAWISKGEMLPIILSALFGGLCGAAALAFLVRSGIFVLGMLGALVTAMHLTAGMEQPWIPWAVFAAGGVGGLLTLFLRRTIVIFASAAIGSWFVVSGILFFFAGPGALQQPSQTLLAVREGWVAVACWAVLAFAGALAQFATRAPAPQPRPRDNPPRA